MMEVILETYIYIYTIQKYIALYMHVYIVCSTNSTYIYMLHTYSHTLKHTHTYVPRKVHR